MGIINWLVQRSMRGEAKRIAKWAKENYDETKTKYPELNEKDIYLRMIFGDMKAFNDMEEKYRRRAEKSCQTIEGLCYMMAMDVGNLKGWMKFRLIQFTRYMDYCLYDLGFEKQTKEQKETIMKAMDIYAENWEEWTGEK